MEWLATIRKALLYIEDNLLLVEGVDGLAKELAISPSYLQQGFQMLTDYSVAEYIRNRRLHQAARDLIAGELKITDIALKYGYDNSSSFSKAFSRFHEASPTEVKKGIKAPKSFLPIQVSIVIRGGQSLDAEIIEKDSFDVIGFIREYSSENSTLISKWWKDFNNKYADLKLRSPRNNLEKAIVDNKINPCGVTEYPADRGAFRYVHGGLYQGGEVPEELEIYTINKGTWAVFNCVGKLPDAMTELSDLIWNHWVPDHPEYEVGGQCEFELYYEGDYYGDPEYLCTKWIPIKRKKE